MICPECGKENEQHARYCAVCGSDLVLGRLDAKARILFFATPPLLLAFAMALAWDLGDANAIETGAEWGLLLAFLYLGAGGLFWLVTRSLSQVPSPITFWLAGMLSVVQVPLSVLLSLPVSLTFLEHRFQQVSFAAEASLRLTLVAALYLPGVLIGLILLARRSAAPAPGQTGLVKALRASLTTFAVPLVTVLLTVGLFLGLPVEKRDVLKARAYTEVGMHRQALAALEKAATSETAPAEALHLKGMLLLARNDPARAKDALPLLLKASQAVPANAKYALSVSLAHEQLGQLEEAIDVASRAARLSPAEPAIWGQLGNLNTKALNRRAAIDSYRKALQMSPGDAVLMNNLAYSMLELNDQVPAALDLARESVRLRPGYLFNQDTLAWALYRNGFIAEAWDTIRPLKALAAGNAEIEYHHGVIATELGLLEKPVEFMQELANRPQVRQDPLLKVQIEATLASVTAALATPSISAPALPASLPPVLPLLKGESDSVATAIATTPAIDPLPETGPERQVEPVQPSPKTLSESSLEPVPESPHQAAPETLPDSPFESPVAPPAGKE
jgi:tetratricopeptide (TPR) repeat protein